MDNKDKKPPVYTGVAGPLIFMVVVIIAMIALSHYMG